MLMKEFYDFRSATRFGPEPHGVAVAHEEGYERRSAEVAPRLGQGRQHRLQIEGRAADDLEDVGGRSLLLQRFVQIPGPRLDLGFERFVTLLDALRHLIEAIGERLDLVAGANLEPL